MANFDIFLAIFLFFSLIYSIFKGMIREIFSLLSLAAGYVVAVRYQGVAGDLLEKYIANETVARLTGFGLLFMFAGAAVSVLGYFAKKVIHTSEAFAGVDRLGGGVFGVVKGVFIMILMMFPLQMYPDVYGKLTRGSIFAPHLRDLSNKLVENLDSQEGFVEDIKLKMKEFKKPGILDEFPIKKRRVKKPQDDHTQADQQELNDMLESIRNESQD